MLLVQGGALDPNVDRIIRAAQRNRIAHHVSLIGAGAMPRLQWRVGDGTLVLDGVTLAPDAMFLRYNVFMRATGAVDTTESAASFQAQAWYGAFAGWAAAHPAVRILNRDHTQFSGSKLAHLVRAARVGLSAPETMVANDLDAKKLRPDADAAIAKPIAGGSYTHTLADAVAAFPREADGRAILPAPAIVQEQLAFPELRIYVVGKQLFAFELNATTLDHREATDTQVRAIDVPAGIEQPLLALARDLKLDFAAADFKTRTTASAAGPAGPVFLEINAQPMFARFDDVAGGALADAIVGWLASTR